jgi:hypothetical protein
MFFLFFALFLGACATKNVVARCPPAEVATAEPVIRLRMESPTDSDQIAAYYTLGRLLEWSTYRVVTTYDDAYWAPGTPWDVDMVIRGKNGSITIASRIGCERFETVCADARDEESIARALSRWELELTQIEGAPQRRLRTGVENAQAAR